MYMADVHKDTSNVHEIKSHVHETPSPVPVYMGGSAKEYHMYIIREKLIEKGKNK
jgi:hypothetical protein